MTNGTIDQDLSQFEQMLLGILPEADHIVATPTLLSEENCVVYAVFDETGKFIGEVVLENGEWVIIPLTFPPNSGGN